MSTVNDVETWTEIIAELCTDAPDSTIRNCLRLYDPVKPSSQLKSILRSKCVKDDILKSLIYLGSQQVVDSTIKKEEAINMLINRVKNLFPDICQICGDKYCIKRDDEPFLSCEGCGQEFHRSCYAKKLSDLNLLNNDGSPNLYVKSIPGFHLLCANCEQEIINPRILKQTVSLKQSSNNESTNQNILITQNNDEIKNPNENKNNENHNDIMHSKNYSNEQNNKKHLNCKFYIHGNCKFGIKGRKCDYNHPVACKKLLKHGNKKPTGCNEGKNCKYFHPRMCSESIKTNKCFDKSCKYTHVKGTIRNQNRHSDSNKNFENNTKSVNKFIKKDNDNDKQMDFLILLQNLKTEIFQTMDRKIAEINNSKTIPNHSQRLMNNIIPNSWTTPTPAIPFPLQQMTQMNQNRVH